MSSVKPAISSFHHRIRVQIALKRLRHATHHHGANAQTVQKILTFLLTRDPDSMTPRIGIQPVFAGSLDEGEIYSLLNLQRPGTITSMPDGRSSLSVEIRSALIKLESGRPSNPYKARRRPHLDNRLRAILDPCIAAWERKYASSPHMPRLHRGWGLKAREVHYNGQDRYLLAGVSHPIDLVDGNGRPMGRLVIDRVEQLYDSDCACALLAHMGILHSNRKEKNEAVAGVCGILTDSYHFRFWRVDNDSKVLKSRYYGLGFQPTSLDLEYVVSNIEDMLDNLYWDCR